MISFLMLPRSILVVRIRDGSPGRLQKECMFPLLLSKELIAKFVETDVQVDEDKGEKEFAQAGRRNNTRPLRRLSLNFML
jgi:hypothetical protein